MTQVRLPGRVRRVRAADRAARGRRAARPRPAGPRRSRGGAVPGHADHHRVRPPRRRRPLPRRPGRPNSTEHEVAQRRPVVSVARPACGCRCGGTGTAAADRSRPHVLRRRRRSSGCRSAQLGEHGLPVRAETLAFGDDSSPSSARRSTSTRPGPPAWPAEYPAEFRALLPAARRLPALHRRATCPARPAATTSPPRHRYDVHDPPGRPRGLLVASRDPLGAEHPDRLRRPRPAADQRDRRRRPDHHAPSTTTGCCSRGEVTDANGNTTAVTFSPAGLVTAQSVRGKDGDGRRRRARARG